MYQHCGSSAVVYQHIAKYLKLALHRKGGAGQGCHVPQQLLQAAGDGDNVSATDEVSADEVGSNHGTADDGGNDDVEPVSDDVAAASTDDSESIINNMDVDDDILGDGHSYYADSD